MQIQRTCFNCKYYSGDGKGNKYYNLMESNLKKHEIRLDCAEFEEKASNFNPKRIEHYLI